MKLNKEIYFIMNSNSKGPKRKYTQRAQRFVGFELLFYNPRPPRSNRYAFLCVLTITEPTSLNLCKTLR